MNTPVTIGERLKQARKGRFTQQEFSDLIGVAQNTLSHYENNKRRPNAPVLQKICDILKISLKWLLSGEGDMYEDVKEISVTTNQSEYSFSDGSEMIPIPMVEARLSAGYGSFEVSAAIEKYYSFSSSFLHRKGNPTQMVVMKVEGDSMSPEIRDGDIVLLDQSQTTIRLGQIYAVGFEDAIYLKRIDKLPGRVLLKSVNPAYPPVEIDLRGQLGDSFRVIGQVLWVGREY